MIRLDKINLLSGLIFSAPSSLPKEGLNIINGVTFEEKILKTSWIRYSFISEYPLMEEDLHSIPGPYHYPLFFRPGFERMLILSTAKKIILYFEDTYLKKNGNLRIGNVIININDLVRKVIKTPQLGYALNYASAFYTPHGNSLKFITYYGDDLGEASIIRDNLDNMVFNRCGIREIKKEHEIAKLGSDGAIQFNYSVHDAKRLNEIDGMLKFINDNGFFQTILK